MSMELKLTIDDVAFQRRLAKIASPEVMRQVHEAIGEDLVERVRDHIGTMSVSRHKTANRLGATPTGFYEHARGRVVMQKADDSEAVVAILNTPGLSRAYRALTIKPKKAKWLTIPLHRIAYAKRVADLRGAGHKIFRPGKAHILAETTTQMETYTTKDGKTRKRKKLRPLYALVKSVTIPQDKGLLPLQKDIKAWALETAKDAVEAAEILGD